MVCALVLGQGGHRFKPHCTLLPNWDVFSIEEEKLIGARPTHSNLTRHSIPLVAEVIIRIAGLCQAHK